MKKNSVDFGKGAIDSKYDLRDYWFSPSDRGGFDWDTGYDIEKKLGVKLVVKDQNGSGSCGGQAWAYYGEVLEAVATGTYEPCSARWIYSHTRVPPSGSNGRANCDHVIKKGLVLEAQCPSYENKKAPKESFFIGIPKLSKEAQEYAEVSRGLSYLKVPANIEIIAQAIETHHGCIINVGGQDNGTWRSKFPKPPSAREWGHWLYAGKVKVIKGKKYIGVINSWGTDTGDKGWQWIGEDYFDSGFVREGWTLAWDYHPAKTKVVLKEVVRLLTSVVDLYKQLGKLK